MSCQRDTLVKEARSEESYSNRVRTHDARDLAQGRAVQALISQSQRDRTRREVQQMGRNRQRAETWICWRPAIAMVLAALRERIPRSGLGLLVNPEPVLGWYRALVLRKWVAETAVSAGRSMTNDACVRQRDLFFEPHTCGNCSIPKRDDRRSRGRFQAGEQLLQLCGEGPTVLFRQS